MANKKIQHAVAALGLDPRVAHRIGSDGKLIAPTPVILSKPVSLLEEETEKLEDSVSSSTIVELEKEDTKEKQSLENSVDLSQPLEEKVEPIQVAEESKKPVRRMGRPPKNTSSSVG